MICTCGLLSLYLPTPISNHLVMGPVKLSAHMLGEHTRSLNLFTSVLRYFTSGQQTFYLTSWWPSQFQTSSSFLLHFPYWGSLLHSFLLLPSFYCHWALQYGGTNGASRYQNSGWSPGESALPRHVGSIHVDCLFPSCSRNTKVN